MAQPRWILAALALIGPTSAAAVSRCDEVLARIGSQLADVSCVESPDLTTNNPDTTPADNSIPTLPPFAFTPRTDRAVIAPSAAFRPPVTRIVPGMQLDARIASDPSGEARFLLRLPDDWNGRLVVAGASGTRSEFNGDIAWSDYVLQKGYAYASQNKGVLNLHLTTAADPLGCRLNPSLPVFVHFYDNDDGQPFSRWAQYMVMGAQLAVDGVKGAYGRPPKYTYAVGTSNGGYQVRRAVEIAPKVFDGGVDWEGTFVDPAGPNLLTDLPPAILDMPDYVVGGRNPDSTAARNIRAAGYPPDIAGGPNGSLWGNYSAQFWEVTQCQWQKRLDPAYDTYGPPPGLNTGLYNYFARLSVSDVGAQFASFETTGAIQAPLITVAGTMDALLPIDHNARAYARNVAAATTGTHDKAVQYRLYEVQNGNHIETYKDTFPQLELIMPHAQHAFDLLVQHVEDGVSLPPSQCIPHGGAIAANPSQPGHCANLFEP